MRLRGGLVKYPAGLALLGILKHHCNLFQARSYREQSSRRFHFYFNILKCPITGGALGKSYQVEVVFKLIFSLSRYHLHMSE